MSGKGKLPLPAYFTIEGLSSFASTLFQQGIFFWTTGRFHYTDTENLLLGATMGLVYVIMSISGGRMADRMGCDRSMQTGFLGVAVSVLALLRCNWHYTPFLMAALYVGSIALVWPSIEAAIMHADSRMAAPKRLGMYNTVWSLTGAAGFFVSGFLVTWDIDAIVWIPAAVIGAQLLQFRIGLRTPHVAITDTGNMDRAASSGPDRATRRRFMHLHWLGNSVAYFLMGGFNALAPHLGRQLGLTESNTIWLICSYLFARAASFICCMLWEGWHYRGGWSLTAIWAAPLCLSIMFFVPHTAAVLAACIGFGFALGLVYSGSLYYSMNYGDTKGEHGGFHEAVLGTGILAGPLAGAAGASASGTTGGAQVAIVATGVTIISAGLQIVRRLNKQIN